MPFEGKVAGIPGTLSSLVCTLGAVLTEVNIIRKQSRSNQSQAKAQWPCVSLACSPTLAEYHHVQVEKPDFTELMLFAGFSENAQSDSMK